MYGTVFLYVYTIFKNDLTPITTYCGTWAYVAIFTNNDDLAKKIKMYSNHGESKRYHHNIIGINSRLDSIQAEVLNVKLKYLNDYNNARNQMAENYNKAFKSVERLQIPRGRKS